MDDHAPAPSAPVDTPPPDHQSIGDDLHNDPGLDY
jgi:hypothetical protein